MLGFDIYALQHYAPSCDTPPWQTEDDDMRKKQRQAKKKKGNTLTGLNKKAISKESKVEAFKMPERSSPQKMEAEVAAVEADPPAAEPVVAPTDDSNEVSPHPKPLLTLPPGMDVPSAVRGLFLPSRFPMISRLCRP